MHSNQSRKLRLFGCLESYKVNVSVSFSTVPLNYDKDKLASVLLIKTDLVCVYFFFNLSAVDLVHRTTRACQMLAQTLTMVTRHLITLVGH